MQEQTEDAVAVIDEDEQDVAPAEVEIIAPVAAGLLTAAEIFGSSDLGHEDVPVPEWTPGYVEAGGENQTAIPVRAIRLLEMSAGQAIEFTDSIQQDAASRNQAIVNIIRLTAVNENGELLFTPQDMEQMRAKSFKVYQRLSDAALRLNGFSTDEGEDEADGDTAAKNE